MPLQASNKVKIHNSQPTRQGVGGGPLSQSPRHWVHFPPGDWGSTFVPSSPGPHASASMWASKGWSQGWESKYLVSDPDTSAQMPAVNNQSLF